MAYAHDSSLKAESLSTAFAAGADPMTASKATAPGRSSRLPASGGTWDDEGFDEAYPELLAVAVRTARRLTGDQALAEDLAAEALARALVKWRRLKDPAFRRAWVLRVTTNLAIDEFRRRRPATAVARLFGIDVMRDDAGRFDEATATRLALVDALRRLPEPERHAVVLHYLAGMTDVEVSASLGVTRSTARTLTHRGLTRLRRTLSADGLEALRVRT